MPKSETHPIVLFALLGAVSTGIGCVREPPPDEKPMAPAHRVTPGRAPLAEHDLAGNPRARPRATMGALEAERGQDEQKPGKPKKRDGSRKDAR